MIYSETGEILVIGFKIQAINYTKRWGPNKMGFVKIGASRRNSKISNS